MALDEALLDAAIEQRIDVPLVRVYRWSEPALSVGRHQRLDHSVQARCTRRSVAIVRRPTGGSAVLHGEDVTYSVVAPGTSRSVIDGYRWIAGGLVAGFARLGLEARVARHSGRAGGPACFGSSVGADLTVGGTKVCGSAQLRRRGWLLQHGSVPLHDCWTLTCELLDQWGDPAPGCLERLRPGTTFEQLESGLEDGFAEAWGPPSKELAIEPVVETEPLSGVEPLPNLLAIL